VRTRLLVDECLSVGLVAVAKSRGLPADHVTWLGKSGWQDRNLTAYAVDNDYVMVTNNRRHFLREYAKLVIHNGLIIIVPAMDRSGQKSLFSRALDAVADRDGDIVNSAVEVLRDGLVHVRSWTSGQHDLDHVSDPKWG
jgi:predicted nuclease of predicted toxin-antitoxin system